MAKYVKTTDGGECKKLAYACGGGGKGKISSSIEPVYDYKRSLKGKKKGK